MNRVEENSGRTHGWATPSSITERGPRASALGTAVACLALAACAHGNAGASSKSGSPEANAFEARRQIAAQLVSRGEWQSAFGYVDQLHRDRPEDADVLVLRATIYRERALLTEAEADLTEALRLQPQLAAAHAALGIILDMQYRPADAEERHRRAVKLEARNPIYLNNLGFSLFLHGKVKEAITFYEQAARLAPAVRRTRTNLGFAYAARGELARAAREFEMGGTAAEAKVNLGYAYERRGDLANAFDLYLEAVHLDPKSQRARNNLVHVAMASGKSLPNDLAPPNDLALPRDLPDALPHDLPEDTRRTAEPATVTPPSPWSAPSNGETL